METVKQYREIIQHLIGQYAQYRSARGEVQVEVIFDEANDHYELIYTGWNGPYRIHGSVVHIDIRQEKIWIQHDGTDWWQRGCHATVSCWRSSRQRFVLIPALRLHNLSRHVWCTSIPCNFSALSTRHSFESRLAQGGQMTLQVGDAY